MSAVLAMDAGPIVVFRVRGIPIPQGSARPFIAGGRARIATKSPALMAWRHAIATAAAGAMGERPVLTGPVRLSATFSLPRPPSIPRKRIYPTTKPDLDKLVRALLDGLTGVVLVDDKLVVSFGNVDKAYGDVPGVSVLVETL
jgi:Holliday junction resolvase RusA-like endonuclease